MSGMNMASDELPTDALPGDGPHAGLLAAAWARIRARLRQEVGDVEYRTWLRQMTLQGTEDEGGKSLGDVDRALQVGGREHVLAGTGSESIGRLEGSGRSQGVALLLLDKQLVTLAHSHGRYLQP